METTLRPTNYIITIREKTSYQLSAKERQQRAHTFCLASAADFGQNQANPQPQFPENSQRVLCPFPQWVFHHL